MDCFACSENSRVDEDFECTVVGLVMVVPTEAEVGTTFADE